MSFNHDYTMQILIRQRHEEMLADAAQARLAREVRRGRPSRWQRLKATWFARHHRRSVRAVQPRSVQPGRP